MTVRRPAWIALLTSSLIVTACAPSAPPAMKQTSSAGDTTIAQRIIDAARNDRQAWMRLTALCERIGARPAGSDALNQAIDWAVAEWTKDKLDAVRRDEVLVQHWQRGAESAFVVAPGPLRPLAMLGLGNSPGTPPGGIEAPLLVVHTFDELTQRAAEAKGKIVLFNFPMKPKENMFEAYGEAVQYRWIGPLNASKVGAVAALVRSVTTRSLRTPHTGATKPIDPVADKAPAIPAAAVSLEDADMLDRLAEAGLTPRVRLTMGAQRLPEAPSANVIAELRGREKPDEIVLIGGHLDSWDVGQGAHDDGTGVIMSMQAISLLKQLGLRPRRTIRAVLFTNEECGLDGARSYAERYKADVARHVAALESDAGGFRPLGFNMTGAAAALTTVRGWLPLFAPLGQLTITEGGAGADIGPLVRQGVPGFGLAPESAHYFDYHHTQADTLDKVDPKELREGVAAFALMTWLLADSPEPLPRQVPKEDD